MIRLGIDAMSGDAGSAPIVEACQTFAKNHGDVELVVVGKEEELVALNDFSNVRVVDARDLITMEDGLLAIRRKKESSMVKTLNLARNNEVDAVLSCGSTAAYYAAAMMFVKRFPTIEKPCLMAVIPTMNGNGTCMLDVGANAENTAAELRDFGIMGSFYAKYVRHIDNPKVALLNNGSEGHKGNEVHRDAYQLLKDVEAINFVGNIEGQSILTGDYDVIVTDGFTGNIALKTIEGEAKLLMKAIKDAMMSSLKGKIGALLAKDSLYSLKERFDYKSVGGALMMGFEQAVIKAHGRSDAKAFNSAMELALTMVKEEVTTKMKEGLS